MTRSSSPDYEHGAIFKNSYSAGTEVIVREIFDTLLNNVTHVTVRDPKTGKFLKKVPWKYFE